MRHFVDFNFTKKEDVQIQIPTSRLVIKVGLTASTIAAGLAALLNVRIRTRLVSPASGTRTVIERMNLRDLLEIGAATEGFFAVGLENGVFTAFGNIEIARGGALALTNQSYLSFDVESDVAMTEFTLLSIAHAKTTNTFLHYNPVTIIAGIQNIPLSRAGQIVLPVGKIEQVQLKYPSTVVEYSQAELHALANALNDIVYVDSSTNTIKAGYDRLIVLPVADFLSGLEASNLQVEPTATAGQFNVYLLEESTL
jgi:hypothetical protein